MNIIRKYFEETTAVNFPDSAVKLIRNERDEYINTTLEDHWQTFQEGWECAIAFIKKANEMNNYTDIKSNGGMDPRS
jgi:hypothetical protein